MTSEIRANKQTNRAGLGTVTYSDTGIIVSGIVTCTELSGLTALNIAGVGTASTLDVNGDIDVDGHTNLDNLSVAGITTFAGTVNTASIVATGIDLNGDLDVDGHTNLDNVSVAGVTTFAGNVNSSGNITISNTTPTLTLSDTDQNPDFQLKVNTGHFYFVDATNNQTRFYVTPDGATNFEGNLNANKDFSVDGHTNLDNVSIAGVSTFTGQIFQTSAGSNTAKITLNNASDTTGMDVGYSESSGLGFINVGQSGSGLSIKTGGTAVGNERLRITSAGKVGINQSSSIQTRLQVSENIADSTAVNWANSTMSLSSVVNGNSTANRSTLYFAPYNAANQYCPSAISVTAETNYQSTLKFFTNGNGNGTGHLESYERLRITSGGLVGIGTDNPQDTLDISRHANHGIILRRPAGLSNPGQISLRCQSFGVAEFRSNRHMNLHFDDDNGNNQFFRIYSDDTEVFNIASDGQVNIGHAISQAPWDRTSTSNTGVRLANSTTGYAVAANSNEVVAIFNRTATGSILECKHNGTVITKFGHNFSQIGGQQNTFRYDNSGGMGAYLSIQNRGSGANTATGISFGCGNSDASMTTSDYGEAQIKVTTDSGLYGNMEFNLHTGDNRSYMKIVGNGQGYTGASAGTEGMIGGVAFGNAGIAIDRSWTGQPGIHVFNQNVVGDTDQGTFRFHGWNTSYASYPGRSGADFAVNVTGDGSGFSSDERKKTGITTITNALNMVAQLRGVSYKFVNSELNPQTHMTMDSGTKLGFVAQEVIPVLPSIVIDAGGEKAVPHENGWCDRYAIDYGSVTPLLAEAIKELKAKNEALEARIAALEGS